MAVYNDVEGWQNMQFWGGGEFALPFGNFDVNITVPADHVMEATGDLTNRSEVFTPTQVKRWETSTKNIRQTSCYCDSSRSRSSRKRIFKQEKNMEI